ncbi:MAG: FAD-dependent oxidoreductase [Rhodococcus sp. (in: high G+C Gram-positive bacteria)]|uniref:FAD-dependent oxidoreductase n=1 Tax=Rhodococcus sp. TaxID=1831 RepID=UPI003BAF47DB
MSASHRPLRVAVVGGGPSGLFTADALTCNEHSDVTVDILERLPVPFGLLRYGVAPDHPNIKSAADTLQEVLDRSSVNLLCNVEIGRTVDVDDLRRHYDALVYATGADADNTLAIPGEDLAGSHSATSFVKWYNGHPEAGAFDLAHTRRVAVVGAGNVALDVTRILVKDPGQLAETDIPHDTLNALAASAVTDVHILARRGAECAKFTTKELRELGELSNVDVIVDADQIPPDPDDGWPPVVKRNMKVLRDWAGRETTSAPRRIYFHFSTRPTDIVGTDTVEAVRVEHTVAGSAGDGRHDIPVELVLRAVGYRSRPIAGIPFTQVTSTIPHENHRVIRDGRAQRGEYAVGWAKRGPTGILGTNRADAEDTAAALFADRERLLAARPDDRNGIADLLRERSIRVLDKRGWTEIKSRELEHGARHGRSRVKIRSWNDLVEAANPVPSYH